MRCSVVTRTCARRASCDYSRRMHLRSAILAAALLLPIAEASAQSSASVDVQILELDASVFDRRGRPVEGLSRDDFQVRVGKRDVPITNFFAVREGTILQDVGATATPAQPLAAETSIPTSLVIFIDDLHLSQSSHARAIESLKRYVGANVGSTMSATLIRYNGTVDVRTRPTERAGYILRELDAVIARPAIDDFSRERDSLIETIDEFLDASKNPKGRPPGGETVETILMGIERYAGRRVTDVDRTLRALEEAIQLASAFSGRKVLLYVSDGLPEWPALEIFEYWDRGLSRSDQYAEGAPIRTDGLHAMRFDRSSAFQRLAQEAQRNGVAIFSFDAAGIRGEAGAGADSASRRGSFNTMSSSSNLRTGLQTIAEETGGGYVANENDIDKVLARISEQFSSYYSIGIRPQRGEIRVTVKNRPELRVIAARHSPPRTREDVLEQSLRSRLYTQRTENPLEATLGVAAARRVNEQCSVMIKLTVPQPHLPPELTPQTVDLRMVMLNEANDESAVQSLTLPFESGSVQHMMTLRIRPERLVLSVAISNPVSKETTFLQGEIDGTTCR